MCVITHNHQSKNYRYECAITLLNNSTIQEQYLTKTTPTTTDPELGLHYDMSDNAEFPNAVRKSLNTLGVVPCAIPYTGIELLQLIRHSHIAWHGFWRRNCVLANLGDSYTLINYVGDKVLKQELGEYVTAAEALHRYQLSPMNVERSVTIQAELQAFRPLPDADLSRVNLKLASDNNWKLNYNTGPIQKKFVPLFTLVDFLEDNTIAWRDGLRQYAGVVTAIYSVTRGISYTGETNLVTTGGMHLDPMPAFQPLNSSWEYKVTEARTVVVSEIDPLEWIIAIEYSKLERGTDNRIRLIAP